MTPSAQSTRGEANGPTFPSKRDLWIELLLLGATATLVGAIVVVLRDPTVGPIGSMATIGLCAGGAGFSLWVLYGTGYRFAPEHLVIRSGPFRWTVPLESVERVRPSRNPLSAPAASLDRLEVRYGGGRRSVLISPADKAGFLRALVARAPQLVLRGDEAVPRTESPPA